MNEADHVLHGFSEFFEIVDLLKKAREKTIK